MTNTPPSLQTTLLTSLTEICIVTPNLQHTASNLLRLGIGPFRIFDFNASTVTNRKLRGRPADFELKVAFAHHHHGGLVFELMQPVRGASLMQEFLDGNRGREGVQHLAFDVGGNLENGAGMEERKKGMQERGFGVVMEGCWVGKRGRCEFAFFDTEADTGMVVETIVFSEDWVEPDGGRLMGMEGGGEEE